MFHNFIKFIISLMFNTAPDPRLQSFEDFVFGFETQFIQLFYELNRNIQSISPQSALMILLVVGFVAPPDIATNLHDSMGLQMMNFGDLSATRQILHRGVALLRNKSEETKLVLGWSWNMVNTVSKNCVAQDPFVDILRLFRSSISETTNERQITTTVDETFNPQLKRFNVECIMKDSSDTSHTFVVKNLLSGKVQSLGNIDFFMMSYRRTNLNVSMIFLNPKNQVELNNMMKQFSKFDFEDLRIIKNTRYRRAYFRIPKGAWTQCRNLNAFRPFFSKVVQAFSTKNQLEGDFKKFCVYTGNTKNHIYHVEGRVRFNFATAASTTDLALCDAKQELRSQTSTDSLRLNYPFVLLIMVDKSIIYSSIVLNDKL